MSNISQSFEDSTDTEQKSSIKKLLKDKNLNPKHSKDLKYLLSLSLLPKNKNYKFNFNYLISLLLKYKKTKNEKIFYDFFFQSCELGKINNVKILLEHNFDVNRQNELGETPLHIAIAKNDEELVKLIIQYEPKTDLVTNKDNFSVINYAEICGNKTIIKIVNELNQKNTKNKIKSEVVDFIQKDLLNMNVNELNNLSYISKNKNLDEIQNYNGEAISVIKDEDSSNNIISDNLSKNITNKYRKDDKNYNYSTTIINDSEFYDDVNPKNVIKSTIYNNQENIKLKEAPQNINLNEIKYFPSPSKKKECTSSIKSSYLQSLKTSHTLSKEHELSPIYKNKNRISKFLDKKRELFKFISEINLPKKFAEILLENGFDDLKVLINQMKLGLALSYQNLKDIGIGNPGDRAKILIHLEEISDNFEFILEQDIIYSNKIPEENNGSLYLFLKKINLEEYFQIFIENGYNNAELLYIQMASKNPITENILRDDLGINKIGHLQRLLISLNEESKRYIKNLEKGSVNNKKKFSIIYEENPYLKSCEACIIF
jgi:ankyrin repeat protein